MIPACFIEETAKFITESDSQDQKGPHGLFVTTLSCTAITTIQRDIQTKPDITKLIKGSADPYSTQLCKSRHSISSQNPTRTQGNSLTA